MDKTDDKIVEILRGNGRVSFSDIGKSLGLSRVAVKKRVAKLESKGVILGYRAVVKNDTFSTEMTTYLITLKIRAENLEFALEYLAKSSEVISLIQITGEYGLLATAQVQTSSEMKSFINRVCENVEGVEMINFQAVLDVIKDGRVL